MLISNHLKIETWQHFSTMEELELLEQQAIEAAIDNKWKKAIKINQEIISLDPQNIDGHLRLGFAYLQIDDFNNAQKHYQAVLKLQPGNHIAKENIRRLKVLQSQPVDIAKKRSGKKERVNLDPDLFLEITGKTKSVDLVNLGQKTLLANLNIGQKVFLRPRKRKIEVRTKDGQYIGSLPDDLSKRLILFMKAKSKYSAYIKETGINNVVVFIKEDKKGRKVANFISFPFDIQSNLSQIASKEKPDQEQAEEEEEDAEKSELEKLAEDLSEEKLELTTAFQSHQDDEEFEE